MPPGAQEALERAEFPAGGSPAAGQRALWAGPAVSVASVAVAPLESAALPVEVRQPAVEPPAAVAQPEPGVPECPVLLVRLLGEEAVQHPAVQEPWPARRAESSAALREPVGPAGERPVVPASTGAEEPHRRRGAAAVPVVRWAQVYLVDAVTGKERKAGGRENARTTSWRTRRPGRRSATQLLEWLIKRLGDEFQQ
ncbi:hypothetical protein C0036_24435 [Streptomyces sp. DJ]|nr:hypothetical protein C0036_24435 [Streptomyces sp. DJ]